MLYAFEPLPSCNNLATLQEEYLSHNLTLEDCFVERRKYISGRVYLAVTIFNAFSILFTTILFIYCASTTTKNIRSPSSDDLNSESSLRLMWKRYSLQKKSVACTTLGAFGHLVFSSSIFASQALSPVFSCYLVLYGSIIGFYTWMFAYCTRAYRLRYLYQLNQFKFKYSRMSDEEKLVCLKSKKYRCYTTQNQKKPENVLRTPFLIYGISIIIILAVTVPTQQHASQVLHRCETTWGAYALLCMFGFFIVILTPIISYSLKENSDAHGIKTELWLISFIGFPLFLLYTVFFFRLSPAQTNQKLYMRRVFAPANWVILFTAFSHLVSVVIPLLGYFPIKVHRMRQMFKRSRFQKNGFTENFDIGGLAPRPVSSLSAPLELTIECLERSLADPYLMNQLQEHAIRDFSSENLLFYEKFLCLQDKLKEDWKSNPCVHFFSVSSPPVTPGNSSSCIPKEEHVYLAQPVPEKLLPVCIELYESFIRENSTFQVNISYKARISLDCAFEELYRKYPHLASRYSPKQHSEHSYNSTIPLWDKSNPQEKKPAEDSLIITLSLFETARSEVCWNIFNSVYPKLIEQES